MLNSHPMRRRTTRTVAHNHGSDLLLFEGFDCVEALEQALSEDNRVRIIGLLLEAPLGVCEIARRMGSTHYNVSKTFACAPRGRSAGC